MFTWLSYCFNFSRRFNQVKLLTTFVIQLGEGKWPLHNKCLPPPWISLLLLSSSHLLCTKISKDEIAQLPKLNARGNHKSIWAGKRQQRAVSASKYCTAPECHPSEITLLDLVLKTPGKWTRKGKTILNSENPGGGLLASWERIACVNRMRPCLARPGKCIEQDVNVGKEHKGMPDPSASNHRGKVGRLAEKAAELCVPTRSQPRRGLLNLSGEYLSQ